MDALVFHASGILAIVAALLVVTRKNPVYSAVHLIVFFILISLQFLVLRAPFLAVVQVFIYAGAIMVLFIFVIMLLNLTPEELREGVSSGRRIVAGSVALLLFAALSLAIRKSWLVQAPPEADLVSAAVPARSAAAGEIEAIGDSLFTTHALPFEFTSVLILVAIVGAIYLTKRRKPPRTEEGSP